jgi:hypothetical protein
MTYLTASIALLLIAGWTALLLVALLNDGIVRASWTGHRNPPRSHVPDLFEPRARF